MDLYSWRWMSQSLRETNYQTDLSARCPVGDVTSRTWVVLQKPEAASWFHRHHLHHFLLIFALINNQSTDRPGDTFLIRVHVFQRSSGSCWYRLVLIMFWFFWLTILWKHRKIRKFARESIFVLADSTISLWAFQRWANEASGRPVKCSETRTWTFRQRVCMRNGYPYPQHSSSSFSSVTPTVCVLKVSF